MITKRDLAVIAMYAILALVATGFWAVYVFVFDLPGGNEEFWFSFAAGFVVLEAAFLEDRFKPDAEQLTWPSWTFVLILAVETVVIKYGKYENEESNLQVLVAAVGISVTAWHAVLVPRFPFFRENWRR